MRIYFRRKRMMIDMFYHIFEGVFSRMRFLGTVLIVILMFSVSAVADPAARQALFGETHIHTQLSFDSYLFGNRNTLDDAYRYARGETIKHPAGFDMKLTSPLDFQAVTDHAVYLGMLPAMHDPRLDISKHPLSLEFRKAKTDTERLLAFQKMFPYLEYAPNRKDDLLDESIVKSAWGEVIDAAQRYNEPGKFTAMIAFEYTSGPKHQNLHRNVFFKGDRAPDIPFSRIVSNNPEDLWNWMDDLRDKGIDTIAVPHNSNGSNGLMFSETYFMSDKPLDKAYAQTRMRNEPLVEVTQVKGDSETHPLLSPNDEWADFETMPFRIGAWEPSQPQGSYVREAYRNGLKLEVLGRGNPYKFGLIGASDTHVAAGAFDEDNYWSKVGLVDGTAPQRGSVPLPTPLPDGSVYSPNFFQTWSASGLAGVWAEENTRASIFDAMRRKETFATTGPRIRVRFFASANFNRSILTASNMVSQAYRQGVSMGSDLLLGWLQKPEFLVWAMRDPLSNSLQRLQIVKSWIDRDGKTGERVYDVACADGVSPDADHRCPDNGARVDLTNCMPIAPTGENELKVIWRDPDYMRNQKSFYYVRVLENPTCRWSSWDALRAGVEPREGVKPTIQERAYSSPIWVN